VLIPSFDFSKNYPRPNGTEGAGPDGGPPFSPTRGISRALDEQVRRDCAWFAGYIGGRSQQEPTGGGMAAGALSALHADMRLWRPHGSAPYHLPQGLYEPNRALRNARTGAAAHRVSQNLGKAQPRGAHRVEETLLLHLLPPPEPRPELPLLPQFDAWAYRCLQSLQGAFEPREGEQPRVFGTLGTVQLFLNLFLKYQFAWLVSGRWEEEQFRPTPLPANLAPLASYPTALHAPVENMLLTQLRGWMPRSVTAHLGSGGTLRDRHDQWVHWSRLDDFSTYLGVQVLLRRWASRTWPAEMLRRLHYPGFPGPYRGIAVPTPEPGRILGLGEIPSSPLLEAALALEDTGLDSLLGARGGLAKLGSGPPASSPAETVHEPAPPTFLADEHPHYAIERDPAAGDRPILYLKDYDAPYFTLRRHCEVNRNAAWANIDFGTLDFSRRGWGGSSFLGEILRRGGNPWKPESPLFWCGPVHGQQTQHNAGTGYMGGLAGFAPGRRRGGLPAEEREATAGRILALLAPYATLRACPDNRHFTAEKIEALLAADGPWARIPEATGPSSQPRPE